MEPSRQSSPGHPTPPPVAAGWSRWRRWWYAAKPASWPKLLVPALVGQAAGFATARVGSLEAFVAGVALTVLLLCFIVFANDAGDEHVDRIKRAMFPEGCSPKTIPDGVLSRGSVWSAGVVAALGCLAWAMAVGWMLPRPRLWLWTVLALGLFVAYTFPPLRLNYRGGGELLEMVGVGAVLPALHVYLQAGHVEATLAWVAPGLLCTALASALASGLSDEVSDRAGGKRTFVTMVGNRRARRWVERLILASAGWWAVVGVFAADAFSAWAAAAGCVWTFVGWQGLRRLSTRATTNAFRGQRAYKAVLHRCIWGAGVIVAIGYAIRGLS